MSQPKIGFIGPASWESPWPGTDQSRLSACRSQSQPRKVDELVKDGASAAASPMEVTAADVIATMLPNSPTSNSGTGTEGHPKAPGAGNFYRHEVRSIRSFLKKSQELSSAGVRMVDARSAAAKVRSTRTFDHAGWRTAGF